MLFRKMYEKLDSIEDYIMKFILPVKPFALSWQGWDAYYSQLRIINPCVSILDSSLKFVSRKLFNLKEFEHSIFCTIRPKNVIKLKTLDKFGGSPHEIILHCAFGKAKEYMDNSEFNFDGWDLSDPTTVTYISNVKKLKELMLWWDSRVKEEEEIHYLTDSQKLTELMSLSHILW